MGLKEGLISIGDPVKTPEIFVSKLQPLLCIQALTISDNLGQEHHQLYKRQDKHHPCDLPLEPAVVARFAPSLSSGICISYEGIVLFMWENGRDCMSRLSK